MKIDIPKTLKDKAEVLAWLKENKEDLIWQKKAEFKKADGFCATAVPLKVVDKTTKESINSDSKSFKVRAIINTTNIRDSHKDVHIDGLWNKSLQDSSRLKHIQEHKMTFSSIIADKEDLKAFTKTYEWKELGYDVPGTTEALVFDSNVKETRNKFMYGEYKDGNVDNHSVGMYYVKIKLAINDDDEDYETEKAEYDKHIDNIANKEEVEKDGYFWAVYEAKAIEGSAVPMGSNQITPTLPIKQEQQPTDDPYKEVVKQWLNS